jgi:hypothetical protein
MRLLAAALLVTACASPDKAPGEWTPGKGDGAFELYEAGPAPAKAEVELDHRVPAYRVESYGGTKLAIDVKGDDGYVIVEGPIDGDRAAIGGGPVAAEDDDSGAGRDAHLDLTLDHPGV